MTFIFGYCRLWRTLTITKSQLFQFTLLFTLYHMNLGLRRMYLRWSARMAQFLFIQAWQFSPFWLTGVRYYGEQ